jgi:hypothetical protein
MGRSCCQYSVCARPDRAPQSRKTRPRGSYLNNKKNTPRVYYSYSSSVYGFGSSPFGVGGGLGVGARLTTARRSLGSAKCLRPERCQGRSRQRRWPKASLYKARAVNDNRQPSSVVLLTLISSFICRATLYAEILCRYPLETAESHKRERSRKRISAERCKILCGVYKKSGDHRARHDQNRCRRYAGDTPLIEPKKRKFSIFDIPDKKVCD